MSFSARYLPAVLLTILSLPTSLWAQTTPKQTTKAARGSISGRITIKEKSVEGVVVSLRKSEYMSPYEHPQRATTDQDGFYRIANVAPGSYEVQPVAPAFVPAYTRDFQRNKTVLVGEDENVENINFALVRGGVITGRVTDADGRPVIQQQVNIFRVEVFQQQQQGSQPRQIYASGGAPTDDRGIYRMFGLMPGRYKIAAGRSDDVFNQTGGGPRSSYKQVFHPDVSDQAKATVIEVGEGTEATNIDITLGRSLQTFSVAGRVVDGEKGLPVPKMRMGLQRLAGQRMEFVSTSAMTNAQGDFVVEALVPGKYNIYLLPDQSSGLRVENATFDIIDQDLNGLTVKLVQGARLSGVVVLESENKEALAKFRDFQLHAYVANSSVGPGYGSSARSTIGPDGSFSLAGLPGGTVQMFLSGSPTNPYSANGFSIPRIELDGVAGPGSGIEIKEGEQLTGVRVVLAYGNAKLRGVLDVENGTLPNGARFFVRLAKPGEKLSNIRNPQVDARGHFMIENLVPGVYEVHASVGGPGMPGRTMKREVSVQDGVTTDITITFDLSTPQKPPQ